MPNRVNAHHTLMRPCVVTASLTTRHRLVTAGLTAALGLSLAVGAPFAKASPVDEANTNGQSKAILTGLQTAFSNIAEEVEPAVVTVSIAKAFHGDKEGEGGGGVPHNVFPQGRGQKSMKGTGSGVII